MAKRMELSGIEDVSILETLRQSSEGSTKTGKVKYYLGVCQILTSRDRGSQNDQGDTARWVETFVYKSTGHAFLVAETTQRNTMTEYHQYLDLGAVSTLYRVPNLKCLGALWGCLGGWGVSSAARLVV